MSYGPDGSGIQKESLRKRDQISCPTLLFLCERKKPRVRKAYREISPGQVVIVDRRFDSG